jgi:NTE family protein
VYPGTATWLAGREVSFHHHVALGEPADYRRLRRFIDGEAVGFVACGGGAYCAAHIGVYDALLGAGAEIDIYGGSSGGGAMAGAFARQVPPVEVTRRTEEIFVRRRAMRHLTVPRYSLLDHKRFDAPIRDHYGDVPIEDFAIPFFALSTNLRTGEPVLHRRGPHWEAVRATSAIPGLLPPFITGDGELLVDGCLLDSVPLEAMRSLKSGPNLVVDFGLAAEERCPVRYEDVPGRREILRRALRAFTGRGLPPVPGIPKVVLKSLMLHGQRRTELGAGDLLLSPPLPADMGILDWKRHRELAAAARAYTEDALAAARAASHPALLPR